MVQVTICMGFRACFEFETDIVRLVKRVSVAARASMGSMPFLRSLEKVARVVGLFSSLVFL